MPPSSTAVARRPGRPPARTGDETRARILDAARVELGKTGYAATSNKQIAEAAGITAAAIYNYFPSKAALYMATVRDAEARLMPGYRAAVAAAPTARAALQALVAASAEAHARDPSLTTFLSALPVEMSRHPEIAEAMVEQPDEIVVLIAEIVERGHRDGELAPGVTEEAVMSMMVACMMGMSLSAATIDTDGAADAMAAFTRLLGGALFAD